MKDCRSADKSSFSIRSIASIALMAASLECAKLVLASLPNIEAVSILLAVYGYVFGWYGAVAALIFCCIEPLIWGFGSWVPAYFCYWPLLSLVFWLLRTANDARRTSQATEGSSTPVQNKTGKLKEIFTVSALAVVMTFLFGIITAVWEICIFSGSLDNLGYRFAVYYVRGIAFYATHVVSNGVIFATLFIPLSNALARTRKSFRL